MNGSRNHFFSGARFALDQDSGVHWCNHVYLLSTARNFGLDPIKSKVVMALLLYECEICSAFSSDQNQRVRVALR